MYDQLLNLMGTMFLMCMVGLVLQKLGIVSIEGKKTLVALLINLILPCNIIKAFCMEITTRELKEMAMVLVISLGIQLFYVVLTQTLYGGFKDGEKQVYQYATLCSNAGFLGNPLSQGVFGDLGLLYTSVFLIPQRVAMWTAGVSYFTKTSSPLDALKKVLLHPCIVAIGIGLAVMLTGWKMPGVLDSTVTGFSSCCTGMTMLYVGTVLGDVDFRSLFSKKQFFFASLRLGIIPAIIYGACMLLNMEPLVTGVCVLMAAMPAGNTTVILAARYDGDQETAAKCVVLTTALSLLTTPLWSILLTAPLM